jgi:hypothetical protein
LQIFQKSPSDLIRTPPRAPVSSFCQLWASGSYFALVCLEGLPAPSEEQKPDERAQGKVGDDLMMLQSLAALDRSQVPDDAVMAVAHSSQMAVLEVPHAMSMHWPAIPSILDRAESIQSKYRALAQLPPAPTAVGGVKSFSHPNTDRPSSSGEAARCRYVSPFAAATPIKGWQQMFGVPSGFSSHRPEGDRIALRLDSRDAVFPNLPRGSRHHVD